MRCGSWYFSWGYIWFFYLILGNVKLAVYYKTNFAMMQYHGYSLNELEAMIPWEREIYIGLLVQYLRDKEEKRKQQEAKRNSI